MTKPLSTIAFLLIATALSGCNANHTNPNTTNHKTIAADQLKPHKSGTITPLHTFRGVLLAGQPQPQDFVQLKKDGIQTVINLRHENELTDFDEPQILKDLGLTYINLPWKKPEELTDDVFNQTRELLSSAPRPLLLHCSSSNRVGAVWIPWRVLDGGLDIEAAITETKTIGLRTPAFEQRAREYIARQRNP